MSPRRIKIENAMCPVDIRGLGPSWIPGPMCIVCIILSFGVNLLWRESAHHYIDSFMLVTKKYIYRRLLRLRIFIEGFHMLNWNKKLLENE